MVYRASEPSAHNLSNDLRAILNAHDRSRITLGDIIETMGDRGFGVLLVLLALPSALPLPAAGYAIPFGFLLSILGLEMLVGRPSPWMPRWTLQLGLSRSIATHIIGWAVAFLARMERWISRRLEWATNRQGRALSALIVITMAVLMMIPIPWTNSFPAFVIFLIGIGITEKDGVFFLAAIVLGILATAFYATITWIVVVFGIDGLWHITDWIGKTMHGSMS